MIDRLLFSFIFLGLISSCISEKEPVNRIFLGGQIVNPSSRTVTLYQGNKPIEMFQLDRELRFQKKYDSDIFEYEQQEKLFYMMKPLSYINNS